MNKKLTLALGSMLGIVLLAAVPAFAATTGTTDTNGIRGGVRMMGRGVGAARPAVIGTVASISGTTLTVTSKVRPNSTASTTATTYTVDASAATVTKAGASSSVSGIAVGDTVMVQGTVSGTSVVAKIIRDGVQGNKQAEGSEGPKGPKMMGNANPIIVGNGQPVVGGAVTAVSGTTLTITNKSNVTYTVNAASSTVQKAGVASTIANVVVGDNVIVQGTVNGTSITASSVIDQGTQGSASNTSTGSNPGVHRGFFGAIGGFFQHLFGF